MVDRVFERNAAQSAPQPPADPSVGYPTSGNPAQGVPATIPGDYWYHMITEALRNVILDAGLTPDHEDLGQLLAAIRGLSATESLPGTIKRASQAKALAGEDNADAMTAKRVFEAFDQFGLGRSPASMPVVNDADQAVTPGFYRLPPGTNGSPFDDTSAALLVFSAGFGGSATQIASSWAVNVLMYRTGGPGDWQAWEEIRTFSNTKDATEETPGLIEIASSAEAKAGASDTLAMTPKTSLEHMQVFGLGVDADPGAVASDADLAKTSGIYRVPSDANGNPFPGNSSSMIVTRPGSNGWVNQLCINGPVGEMATRVYNGFAWQEWVYWSNTGKNIAVFDVAGTTTWTVPYAIKGGGVKASVQVVGAGGGGAGPSDASAGSGGGGGGCAKGTVSLGGVTSVPITVGAGGLGSTSDGAAGGTSSFGAYMSATGGNGGDAAGGLGDGAGGGSGTGGDINLDGGSSDTVSGSTTGTAGGSSVFAGAGRGTGTSGGNGGTGSNGGGGGGARSGGGRGGHGGDGIVIVEW